MIFDFLKKQHREKLEKHNIGGNTFWTWKNSAELPYRRQLKLMSALKSGELGLTKGDLYATISTIKDSLNVGDIVKASGAAMIAESFLQRYSNYEVNFQIADVVILLENEDDKKPDELSSEKKRKLYESNEEIQAFFLSRSLSIFKEYAMLPNTLEIGAFSDYLKEGKMTEQIYRNLIQTISSSNTQSK